MNATVTPMTATAQPPKAPGSLPYVGHMLEFGRKPLDFIDKTAGLGAVVELKIPGRRAFQLLVLCVGSSQRLADSSITAADALPGSGGDDHPFGAG